MTRSTSVWLSLAASAVTHGVFAWQLQHAPGRAHEPPARDTFQVRMVSGPPPVPPPPPAATPPLPPPEPPEPPPAPKTRPEPRLTKSAPAKPTPLEPPAPAELVPAPPEPSTAPPALLADTGAGSGGIVQLAGASLGALATATSFSAVSAAPAPAREPPPGEPLARLSDLSRRPRAPSLDAALRQNYPLALRRRGTEGQAEVRVVIDARGHVADVAVISESAAGFAEACRRTVLGSSWSEPLDRDGQPVSTRLTYRCRFEMK